MKDTKEYIKKFGELIGRLRKERGLSQEELGKLSNTSQMTIQRLENASGGTKLESIIAVANGLNLGLIDLFKEVEKRSPKEIKDSSSEWQKMFSEIQNLSTTKRKWFLKVIKEMIRLPE